MADDVEPTTDDPVNAWGTREELLLASAVDRHGFHDWDSVALELQVRSSLPNLVTTARNCELKFRDLKRRFSYVRKDGVVSEGKNSTDFGDDIDGFPWVDELRKLRVAELRRQVQRSDFSIHSLQLKVKRLEEERDRSLEEKEISIRKSDPGENSGEQRSENDNGFSLKSDRSEPERTTVRVLVSGEESDRLYHSVNESNSTGSRSVDAKTGEENTQSGNKPGLFCSGRPEPLQRDSKQGTADSDNASSDTVAKNPASEPLEPSQEKKVQESSEFDDSRARSNGEEEETRESSEVQSSASLAGKKRRRREISSGTISEQAPPQAKVSLEQLPNILRIVQAHHHSPSFESRLRSQGMGSEEYKNIVRRHIDLETIRGKLHEGSYALLPRKFYRDLLLLLTNAVIFFPKPSDESMAAGELLQLVSTAMKKTQVAPTPSPFPSDSSPSIPFPSQVPKLERSDSVPIVVCRKRSSIAAKPSSLVTDGNKGDEYQNDEKKSSFDPKLPVKSASTVVVEESGSIKENRVREKPVTGARSSRRSNDGVGNVSAPPSGKKQNASCLEAGSVYKLKNPKRDKKNPETVPVDKRRSAADFLERIKQNTPSETINSGGEQKKGGTTKGEKLKERSPMQNREKKRPKQDNSPSKRSIGRPPKKVAEKSSGSTKRTREVGGKEPDKRPRKRSKR